MTYQELSAEIGQLPLDQQELLLEALTRSRRTELRPTTRGESSTHRELGLLKPAGPTDIGMRFVKSEL